MWSIPTVLKPFAYGFSAGIGAGCAAARRGSAKAAAVTARLWTRWRRLILALSYCAGGWGVCAYMGRGSGEGIWGDLGMYPVPPDSATSRPPYSHEPQGPPRSVSAEALG